MTENSAITAAKYNFTAIKPLIELMRDNCNKRCSSAADAAMLGIEEIQYTIYDSLMIKLYNLIGQYATEIMDMQTIQAGNWNERHKEAINAAFPIWKELLRFIETDEKSHNVHVHEKDILILLSALIKTAKTTNGKAFVQGTLKQMKLIAETRLGIEMERIAVLTPAKAAFFNRYNKLERLIKKSQKTIQEAQAECGKIMRELLVFSDNGIKIPEEILQEKNASLVIGNQIIIDTTAKLDSARADYAAMSMVVVRLDNGEEISDAEFEKFAAKKGDKENG